eukprot:scaffold242756_cov24-Attheya_sp.AAC.1
MEPLSSSNISSSSHPPHHNKAIIPSTNHTTTEGSVVPPSKKKSRGGNNGKNKSATTAASSSSDSPKPKWTGSPYVLYGTQQIRLDAVASETAGMGDVACPLLPHSLLLFFCFVCYHGVTIAKFKNATYTYVRTLIASFFITVLRPVTAKCFEHHLFDE